MEHRVGFRPSFGCHTNVEIRRCSVFRFRNGSGQKAQSNSECAVDAAPIADEYFEPTLGYQFIAP
jgi:hypothetical protein